MTSRIRSCGLNFNRERCVWELTKTETELWKEPEDPLLEKIKELVTEITARVGRNSNRACGSIAGGNAA